MNKKMSQSFPRQIIYRKEHILYYITSVKSGRKNYVPNDSPLENKNVVAEVLNEYKRNKLIKNCSNLNIVKSNGGHFYPNCSQSFLIWKKYTGEKEIFLGCPNTCKFYVSTWKKFFSNKKNQFILLIKFLWREFNKQPFPIQVIIWLIFLSLIASKPLIATLEAIKTLKS